MKTSFKRKENLKNLSYLTRHLFLGTGLSAETVEAAVLPVLPVLPRDHQEHPVLFSPLLLPSSGVWGRRPEVVAAQEEGVLRERILHQLLGKEPPPETAPAAARTKPPFTIGVVFPVAEAAPASRRPSSALLGQVIEDGPGGAQEEDERGGSGPSQQADPLLSLATQLQGHTSCKKDKALRKWCAV